MADAWLGNEMEWDRMGWVGLGWVGLGWDTFTGILEGLV
jgi:hypothetical protein